MGCGCGRNKFQRNVGNGGVYGPRHGFASGPQRELPTPLLRQMALKKQIAEQGKQQNVRKLKTMRQKMIKDKIQQLNEKKARPS